MESNLELDVADAPPRRRVRRRHVVVGTVAAAIVVVAALLVLTSGKPSRQHLAVADSSESSSSTSSSTSASSAVTATSDTVDSNTSSSGTSSTVGASPTKAPSSPAAGDSSTTDTTVVAVPRSAFESVTMTPAHPVTGQEVTFVANVTNRKMNEVVLFHRDNSLTSRFPNADNSGAADPFCRDTSLRAPSESIVFKVTFQVPGHHQPVIDMGACGPGDSQVFWPLAFDVAAGSNAHNGPALPEATRFVANGPNDVVIDAADSDGALVSVVVDWGDGSTPTTADQSGGMSQRCDAVSDYLKTDMSYFASHAFSTAGPHTVTVTVSSTWCDGSEPQSTSSTFSM